MVFGRKWGLAVERCKIRLKVSEAIDFLLRQSRTPKLYRGQILIKLSAIWAGELILRLIKLEILPKFRRNRGRTIFPAVRSL